MQVLNADDIARNSVSEAANPALLARAEVSVEIKPPTRAKSYCSSFATLQEMRSGLEADDEFGGRRASREIGGRLRGSGY